MPRRVNLPGAAELFRPTQPVDAREPDRSASPPSATLPAQTAQTRTTETAPGRGSGRVRHDEKITVYVSTDELVALEEARLALRARHRMAVDRGRIVREAIAAALADLADRGEESEIVRRLSQYSRSG
jgi:hypothetical protein